MKKLILQTETFLKNMRWRAFWFEKKGDTNDETDRDHKKEITRDFKSTKTPPQSEFLKPFERDIYNLIGNIEFRRVDDPILQEIGEEVKRINDSSKVIVNADKTGNKYEIEPSDYKKLLHNNITQDYKLDTDNKLADINKDTQKYARALEIEDKMECHSKSNAFITIKDYKQEFPNSIKCRVINPASNNLGRVSKRILDKVNHTCRDASGVNQWRSIQDVLQWFSHVHSANPTKEKAMFVQFDICEFYPSITEELLRNSLDFAKCHTSIDQEDEDLIMACRKSVLFSNRKVWTKKNKDFDVTMGAQDGAEIAELTGIYLLKEVDEYLSTLTERCHAGLYRDDGLIYLEHANGPLISKIEKALHRIFKKNQLKISMEQKGHTVNFLDVTISTDGSHKISSSEEVFNEAKSTYQQALGDAGYSEELTYNTDPQTTSRSTRRRRRTIVWYNPPYSKNVATNIGKEFFKLLQLHFPKQHPLHSIFNKNTVKLSYSCTTNMDNIVKAHNAKILLNDDKMDEEERGCNCRDKAACPVANKCQKTNVVYKATVEYGELLQNPLYLTQVFTPTQ